MSGTHGATRATPHLRGDPESNLRQFLAAHGHSPDEILDQIGAASIKPELVVASGSVVAGYGNAMSDVDVYVVGEIPDNQGVPLVSHELGALLDVTLISAEKLRVDVRGLQDNLLFQRTDRPLIDQWKSGRRDISQAIRLTYGIALADTPEWRVIMESLNEGWLTDRTEAFWRFDAWRRLLSARWLRARKPLVSSGQVCEAILCALKAVTTRAGYLYFSPKWLPVDLRSLGRQELVARYREALRTTGDVAALDARLAAAQAFFEDDLGWSADDLRLEVSYMGAVAAQVIRGTTLVSRWEARGALFDTALPPVPRDGRPVWTGGAADELPPELHELFALGMVWLGVRDAAR